jgi:hypothetical protein
MVLGVGGGLLGEEIGVQIISLLPKEALLSGFTVIDFIPLAVSFLPFLALTILLVFRFKSFRSYSKGAVFSIAYYLPFQYRAIFVSVTDAEIRALDSLSGRLLVTFLVVLLLSGVYYAFIRVQGKLQKIRT